MHFDRGLVPQKNLGRPFVGNHQETTTPPEEVVALTADHLSLGLARLGLVSRPLTPDPPELADDRQPHRVIADPARNSHPNPTVGWVDAKVEVLDVLPDDLNREAPDGELMSFNTHADSSPIREPAL